jgi:glutamyl-tRNA reductase
MQLICIGANHQTAPVAMRSQLFIPFEALSLSVPILLQKTKWRELVVLSTCNRFEIYAVAPVGSVTEIELVEAYTDLHTAAGRNLSLSVEELCKILYVHLGENAVRHAMRVAAGLDSLVVGETQITGQFKDAFALARQCSSLGPLLTRLEQESLALAKTVRSQTEIGRRSVSVGSAAVELVGLVFGDLRKHKVMVIGAGEMARIASQHILKRQPRQLQIVNRSLDRANQLVAELGTGVAFGLDALEDLLVDCEVVISATASEQLVIHFDTMERVHQRRRQSTMCLVDIALPSDIDPRVSLLDGIYRFDIDDLRQVVDRNLDGRRSAVERADGFVQNSAAQYIRWLESHAFRPVLAELDDYLDQLFKQELRRSLGKDPLKSLKPDQHDQILRMLESIRRKLMADIGLTVKSPPLELSREQILSTLAALFDLAARQTGQSRDKQSS